jgi:hypothetical protein
VGSDGIKITVSIEGILHRIVKKIREREVERLQPRVNLVASAAPSRTTSKKQPLSQSDMASTCPNANLTSRIGPLRGQASNDIHQCYLGLETPFIDSWDLVFRISRNNPSRACQETGSIQPVPSRHSNSYRFQWPRVLWSRQITWLRGSSDKLARDFHRTLHNG